MSEELKQEVTPNVEPAPEKQNIDNETKEQKEEKRMVPLSELISERKKRQAYEKQLEESKGKVEIADRLMKTSNTDLDGLRSRLNQIEQSRTPQYQPPATPKPNNDNSELAELRARLDMAELNREIDSFEKEGLIDLTSDVRDDLSDYAKEHKLSFRAAAFAKYGEEIVQNQSKAKEKASKTEAADMSFFSNVSGGDSFAPSEKVELTAQEKWAAKMSGMTEEEFAMYSSNDSARKFHQNKNKKQE